MPVRLLPRWQEFTLNVVFVLYIPWIWLHYLVLWAIGKSAIPTQFWPSKQRPKLAQDRPGLQAKLAADRPGLLDKISMQVRQVNPKSKEEVLDMYRLQKFALAQVCTVRDCRLK